MSESKKNVLPKHCLPVMTLIFVAELIGRLRRPKENDGFANLSEINCYNTCISMCVIL